MTIDARVFDALADLVTYPDARFAATCRDAVEVVLSAFPGLEGDLESLLRFASEQPTEQLEEVYTRTFDGSTANSLEVGWHIFGENYTRGAFLVHMRQQMRELGLAESSELPDHLTHVLAVLGRLPEKDASRLAADSVAPALRTVKESLARSGNLYHGVIVAIEKAVESRILPGEPRRAATLHPSLPPQLTGGEWAEAPEPGGCGAMFGAETENPASPEDCKEACPLPSLFPGVC
jgi:nitrate reductase assembly molybdenum cofactor insertion protein NarJ